MGKRLGGQRSSSIVDREKLKRRVESLKHKFTTLDEIVDHLLSDSREYPRMRRQPFRKVVQQALDSLESSQKKRSGKNKVSSALSFDFEDDDEGVDRALQKKMRRIDKNEEKLQRLEELHLERRQLGHDHPSTSLESESNSSSSSSSSDEEDGEVSTSEDAIYGEQLEPKFDLMKSMLRATYIESSNSKSKLVEKNEEMEVASTKADKIKVGLRNGIGGSKTVVAEVKKDVKSSVSHGVDDVVKGKGGPRFRDLGGMRRVLEELKNKVIVPLYHPHLPQLLGIKPMSGILLHGPPGCGKTKLAHAIANEAGVPFYKISATEVVSGVSGASEENIRELFSKAYRTAPSIVFIDEIDAIASKRENMQREMEKRIVTQLMTCMDDSHRLVQPRDKDSSLENSDSTPGYVLVIGATNRPDAVDPALRRPGRFDREIFLGVPDENARFEILSLLTGNLKLEGSFDLLKIARATPGFVGADLEALANEAGNLAMERIIDQKKHDFLVDTVDEEHADDWWKKPWLPEELERLTITMADFEKAATLVQPSSRREGFSTVPNVKWEDVGGLDFLRQEFERDILRPIKFPEEYAEFGVDMETGFLLYGPPGCGKTLIAKAVANEAGANFIHIKGPELLNKYVGESELAVRTLFSRARTCSPCILFFDEVDALTTKRGKEGGWVVERLLNQLLIELDGADQRRGVFVIGATNRPEVMDSALLRPGRLGKLLYVPLPSSDERGLILKALGRKKPIDATVDLGAIAQMESSKNLSGADLAALMNEAAKVALEEKLKSKETSADETPWRIKTNHFEKALTKISPSVSDKQRQYYQTLSERFRAA